MGSYLILSLFGDHDRSRVYCKYKEKSLQDFKQEKCFNMIINNIVNNNCYHLAF